MKLYATILFLSTAVFTSFSQSNLQKATMQFDMRDYSLAISSFEQAHANEPDNQDIVANIASSYVQLQDYLKASQWYAKIVDGDDVKPEYLIAYGDVLKSLRLYAKAKFYYQKLGNYDPELAAHYVNSCDVARIEMNGEPYYEIKSMQVNSRGSEFSPFLLSDDLLFSSFRTDIPVEQKRKSKSGSATLSTENSVFMAQKHGASEVQHFENAAIGDEFISNVKYSEDGKWVAFQKSDFRDGQRLFDNRSGKISLYTGKVLSSGEWTDVKAFTHNGNESSTGYPSLSPDGSVLYFASTRSGGEGGWDIYVSFRSLNGWTSPQNMGNVVNTPGNEIAPYYSDHKLFFSSDWHAGIGGFDIFKATSQDGQWTNVRSMGYPLNSPKDDIDFTWDPVRKIGYFASNRIGSTGGYDIYYCTPLYEEIIMTVMDQKGEHAVKGALITFAGAKAAPVETDENGRVIIHQRLNETSSLVISHDDYKNLDMTLKAPGVGPGKYDVYIDKSLSKHESDIVTHDNDVAESNKTDVSVTPTPISTNREIESREPLTTTTTVVVGDPKMSSATQSASEGTTTQVEAPPVTKIEASDSNAKTQVASTPVSSKKISDTDESRITMGLYAVQIAAVGKSTSLDRYSSLSTIGKVMQYPENGLYKIRVGYYDDESQAKNALRSIKSSGYPDAFIVRANPANSVPINRQTSASTADPVSADYLVRLGTYSRPEFFDASKVEHLGEIGTYMSGKFTIMLLRGFKSYATADQARRASVVQGFKDAYIVVEKDGALRKVTN